MQIKRLAILSCFALFAAMAASPASALTMKECSTKYNAAKDAGTLDGRNWTAFRKAECGTDDSAEAAPAKPARKTSKAAATSTTEEEAGGLSMKVCSAKYQAAKDADALNGLNGTTSANPNAARARRLRLPSLRRRRRKRLRPQTAKSKTKRAACR